MLWLCLYLPQLPLEVFTRGCEDGSPLVVHCGSVGRPRVVAANPSARSAGINSGLALAAARALQTDLSVHPRDQAAERRALEALAAWSGQFTSMVSLVPPNALLLEVAGSLRFFGGLHPLLAKLKTGIGRLGYQVHLATAPTPLAATLLARQGEAICITGHRQLVRALSQLPLTVLGLEEEKQVRLTAIGLCRLGDVLRLPRDGLARRFGTELLSLLDRALGRLPDPRMPFVAPPRFAGHLLLPAEVKNTEALLFGLQRLIRELVGLLRARVAGVRAMTVQLVHGPASLTEVQVGMVTPGRDERYLLELLKVRLEREHLTAPVREIRLLADAIESHQVPCQDLFPGSAAEAEDMLIERLRARLGEDAVCGISPVADHRPEFAWCWSEPGQGGIQPLLAQRPLWLLSTPRVLKAYQGRPCLEHVLTLWPERERIESGWWDGKDIRRDYFVAEDREGIRYWVFRELSERGGWFLHGVFG